MLSRYHLSPCDWLTFICLDTLYLNTFFLKISLKYRTRKTLILTVLIFRVKKVNKPQAIKPQQETSGWICIARMDRYTVASNNIIVLDDWVKLIYTTHVDTCTVASNNITVLDDWVNEFGPLWTWPQIILLFWMTD